MKRVPSLTRHYLLVLILPILHDEVDLVLKAEKEQHSLLPCYSLHVHVIYLHQNKLPFYQICDSELKGHAVWRQPNMSS